MENETTLKNNRIILFDFDGVIVDSFKTGFEAERMLRPGANFTEDNFRKLYEGNVYDALVKEYEDIDVADKQFFKIYIPKFLKLPVIEGVSEALAELSLRHKLIVVSSTISSPIREWLEGHDLAKYFTEIIGSDVHRSKVEKIKMVFEKYGVGADDCVFITDTLGDMREAGKLGIRSLAVTYGFHDENTLAKGGPAGFIRRPQEILAQVEKYWTES